MRRLRIRYPHAVGLTVGAVLAVLVLHDAESSPPTPGTGWAPPQALPAPLPANDRSVREAPTHIGRGSDGAWVVLWAHGREWRWEVATSEARRCGSAATDRAFAMTHGWGPPRGVHRFSRSDTFAEPLLLAGRPGIDRAKVRMVARRGARDRVRGTVMRADVFRAQGVATTTCRQSFRFELRPL